MSLPRARGLERGGLPLDAAPRPRPSSPFGTLGVPAMKSYKIAWRHGERGVGGVTALSRGFVLIDVVPGREESVLASLAKVPAVLARRKLQSRAKFYEILALLEAETDDDLERVTVSALRSVPGVKTVQPITIEFTMTGPLQKVMEEMEREVDSRLAP